MKLIKYLFLNILLVILIFFQYALIRKNISIEILEIEILLIFLLNLYEIYTLFKTLIQPYIFFNFTFFIFILVRPILNIFGNKEISYGENYWLKNFYFSLEVKKELLFYIILFMLFLHMGYMALMLKDKKKSIKIKKNSIFDIKIAKVIFMIGGIGQTLKILIYYKSFLKYGYNFLYSSEMYIPLIIKILSNFLRVGYFILLCSTMKKKKCYFYSIIFIILYSTNLIVGFRMPFFSMLLTILIGIKIRYELVIKNKYVILLGVLVVLIAEVTLLHRYNIDFSLSRLNEYFHHFFYSQGTSLLILGFLIQFKENFNFGYKIFFSPVIDLYNKIVLGIPSHTIRGIEYFFSPGDQIQYFLDKTAYLKGAGVGSSLIGEIYFNGNIFMFIVFSFIYGVLLYYISSNLLRKKFGLFIFLFVFPRILLSPRSPYLGFVFEFIVGIFCYALLFILVNFLKRKEK